MQTLPSLRFIRTQHNVLNNENIISDWNEK